MIMHSDKPPTCLYSDNESLCKTLNEKGVPQTTSWRSLFFCLLSQQHRNGLSNEQKKELQNIYQTILQTQDFSDKSLQQALIAQKNVLNENCIKQLQEAIEESEKMMNEFRELSMKRSGQVELLETTTITTIKSGKDPDSMVSHLRSAFRSLIDMMKKDTSELEYLSKTDQLTGLGNRRAFDLYLEHQIKSYHPSTPLSLLLIDIDHFKVFNDNFGHRIGDQALSTVAKIIKGHMQEYVSIHVKEYLAARFGGEEFTVVLPGFTLKEAIEAAEKIREKVKSYSFVIRDIKGKIIHTEITITVSIGVALHNQEWINYPTEHLIDAADQAMYKAKTAGRNKVCY